MKIPVKWLKDYVSIDVTPKELGDLLTLSGSNVEEVIITGDEIENVVTGKLLKIEKHPDAEKLVICELDVASGDPIIIVTGADNMKEGDIVPVALHGSTLAGGVKIKKGKLRGVVSNGMMCSEEELGIADENSVHGLMILPKDTPIGKDIKDVLGLHSAVIDFEITSNRPDCLSVIGIARETAATLNTKYTWPKLDYKVISNEDINDNLKVRVEDTLCSRYMAREITNVKIEPSPAWMQERLMQAGMRPINNIVDITNFVMIELGQPMHAFDAREISSKTIVVKRAGKDEKFITLDENERNLNSDVLTIRDGDRVVAIAGIMGGLNSEVKDDTSTIIFECANFNGTNIRVSSQKLNLRTEASSRFEKDIDDELAEIAMNRACNLVCLLGAGEVASGTIDIYPSISKPHTMTVDSDWVNRFLGTDISSDSMKCYLDRIELMTRVENSNLIITVPTFRGDINIKEDIAEEIARIYGYNNIPSTVLRSIGTDGGKNKKQHMEDKIVESLICSGFNQSISYSFVSPKVFDLIEIPIDSELRTAVEIRNPLGEDFSIMRTVALPSMMESLSRNYSRNNVEAFLFEIGKVYLPVEDKNKLPRENNILSLGMYGNVDYIDVKGAVENVFESLGISGISFQRESSNPSYHPGKTATIYYKKEYIGTLGEVHPDVSANYGIDVRCFAAEIQLDVLFRIANLDKKYKQLPKYPAVSRDIALIVDEGIMVQQINDVIIKQGGNMVENVKLFDVYKGIQVPEGKKSIAYSIMYRLDNKTLTDVEVNKVHDKIIRSLEYNLGAKLR